MGGVAQTVGSGLWRAKSCFSSGPKLPFKPLKPLKPLKRFDACQWFCHTSGFWTLQTLHGRFRRSKTSHLLDCGHWALCETVGGVAQLWARGSGAPNLFFLVARNCPSNPSNPSNASTLANGSAIRLDSGRFRRSMDASDAPKPQTLQNLALATLWALGSVRDCGRSCADCGLRALARQIFFSSGPKLLLKPLKPLKRFDTCQWFCHTSGFWTLQTLHGRFRRSKTSHLLDCGLWALCETVGGVAQTVGSGLWRAKSFFSSGPKLPFKPLKPLKRFDTCQWFCHTSGFWTLARLWALGSVRDCGRSCADCGLGAPKPRTC